MANVLENSKQLRKTEGRGNRLSSLLCLPDGGVIFHTYAKVVRIMRQNACTLAFCAKSVIIHTLVIYKLIKASMGVNCNMVGRYRTVWVNMSIDKIKKL